MLDAGPLGPTAGARGVDHVREVAGVEPNVQVVLVLERDLRPVRIQKYGSPGTRRQSVAQFGLCQQHWRGSVLEHEAQARRRIIGIQWHVHPSRLENAQDPHHRLQAALHADADHDFRPHPMTRQVTGDLISPVIEFSVREPLSLILERYCVGRAPRLRLKNFVDTRIARVIHGCLVPIHQQLLALSIGEQR